MFILATTELHKVPATILSRCQRYAFKRILPADIAKRLTYVAGQEHIDLTPDGAELLSRLADGALRDGLSLLDQCAAAGGTVDSRNDHRIAMAAAIAATVCREPVTILGAECVEKSYPGFFEEYRKSGGSYEQYLR